MTRAERSHTISFTLFSTQNKEVFHRRVDRVESRSKEELLLIPLLSRIYLFDIFTLGVATFLFLLQYVSTPLAKP